MWMLDKLADERIQAAIDRGELSGLAGEGKPLRLDDDSMVPEDLRVAYRVLRNAGYLPPEVQTRREIRQIEDLLGGLGGGQGRERDKAEKRLNLLRARLDAERGRTSPIWAETRYESALVGRFAGSDG